MKKILSLVVVLTVAISFAAPTDSFAKRKRKKEEVESTSYERPYGMAGCGFGSQLIGKRGGQLFAATTNGSTYNQLFAITSGTSNCVDGPTDEMAKKMDNFIHVNKGALASDMARGQGETLAALGNILGCQNADEFGQAMQNSFGQIYTSEKVETMDVTDSVITVIINDKKLNQSCVNLNMG